MTLYIEIKTPKHVLSSLSFAISRADLNKQFFRIVPPVIRVTIIPTNREFLELATSGTRKEFLFQ